jgi:hypothetical protein
MNVKTVGAGPRACPNNHSITGGRRGPPLHVYLFLVFLFATPCRAAEPMGSRVFFSDASISFAMPNHWDLSPAFPMGPLYTKKTQEGTDAFIACRVSNPVGTSKIAASVSTETLKAFAERDAVSQAEGTRILAAAKRTLAGLDAYEITWEISGPDVTVQVQTVYFFHDNRYYSLSLRAQRESFLWLVPDFQGWLNQVRLLSRRDAGALDTPAHGGVWIHQTGGARVTIPEPWLIGVADDRSLGAAFASDKMHVTLTITVDTPGTAEASLNEKQSDEIRKALEAKHFKVTELTEEPFHGLPSIQASYEGAPGERFVRGQDIYVFSPKGRWLINMEGDAPLLRQTAGSFSDILNDIHFL